MRRGRKRMREEERKEEKLRGECGREEGEDEEI